MSVVELKAMPDTSRIWIFGADRELSEAQVQELSAYLEQFMENWTAHRRELQCAGTIKYERFLFIAVDESRLPASGCSIDSMVNAIRQFEQQAGIEIVNTSAKVFFRDSQESICCVDRVEFKQLVLDGQVVDETVVFNNVIETLAEYRNGKWEIPFKESWHARAFPVPVS